MARYIDADKLPKYTGYALSADEVAMAVENAPTVDIDAITESHEKIGYDKGFRDGYAQATVDAVEVVRCKDCKMHTAEEPGIVFCPSIIGSWMEADGYCSLGVKKNE